jgi:3-hydroxyisobutyrate dehydrogenase
MTGANGSGARVTVAVIGAGIMGSAMTRNLVAAGVNTRVWDGSRAATRPLADAGAVVAPSARKAVRDADVVITMLPTADAVESVIFDDGAADAFADGCAPFRSLHYRCLSGRDAMCARTAAGRCS